MKTYQAVVFDLDGVIVDTARYHYRAWEKILREHFGIRHTQEVDEKTKGIGRYACMKLILSEYRISLPEEEVYAVADEKNRYYVHLLQTELDKTGILPGMEEALGWLKERRIPTALASSSYNAPLIVEKLGLSFDYIVNPGEIEHGKPAPDIYLRAAEHLQISPEDCIGVEDAASGVEAITSAGMYCIGIGSPELLEKSDKVIGSTRELQGVLAGLLK